MGVSKNLNRLGILGLLVCGTVWAQETVSVSVGLTTPGPIFLIDGQPFTSPQVVDWEVGSSHQVYFVQSEEADGSLQNHQFPPNRSGIRYTFSGWNLAGQSTIGNQGTLLTLTVQATLTQIRGTVITEVGLYIYFNGFTDSGLPCSSNAVPTTRARESCW